MKLYVKRTFSAAHFLPDYEGDCKNMHGHEFKVNLKLEGDVNPETGMLADFKQVKNIIDELDHCCLNDVLPEAYLPPTAENLARYFLHKVPYCINATVWESENCAAQVSWSPPLQRGHYWSPPDYIWLYEQYVFLKKTRNFISEEVGASSPTIKKWLQEADIPLRTRWKPPSSEWLNEQYVILGKSASSIAEEVGTHTGGVLRELKQIGIPIRGLAKAQSLRRQQEFPHLKGQHSLRTCRRHAEEVLWEAEIPEICNYCGRSQEETLVEVHHKDNDERNNQLENLEWLCRSCHMYTRSEVGYVRD